MRNKKRRKRELIIALLILLFAVSMTGCGGISDGEYAASVSLTGGSGKAHIESPCKVIIKNKEAKADIIWSSSNYDYMIVDGETYYPVNEDGNSEFIIPIELDKDMEVMADTTAMSTAHLIEYKLKFTILNDDKEGSPEDKTESAEHENPEVADNKNTKYINEPPVIDGLSYISTDKNEYAECYAVHRYNDGYVVISVDDGRNYLIVPKGQTLTVNTDESIVVLYRPLNRIYLAASGAMSRFDAIGETDSVVLSGIEKDNWYIESAKKAMEDGTMEFGGKYSAPDYEKIIVKEVNLAVENTMILHTPKVIDKLYELNVPVFIDRCSYEKEPLGRLEWIKVYGLLTDKEERANEAFEEQAELVKALEGIERTGKTVVVFSINTSHMITTKKKNDYFSKMIEIAGGSYIGPDREDDKKASSQVKISIESFYKYASGADIIIYNSTIEDVPKSLEELRSSDVTFKDFKAFKTGDVYYTDKSLYQFADKTGTIIDNLSDIIMGQTTDTEFFHKLR